ncbi:MAG: TetR/AcrR family transcriptional regulator [Candidatus Binatia bacterium]
MSAVATKVRRTQSERSARTRAKLLDATIGCLYERGYAGTTTTEVADRAGVSRGAQLHHFPTKHELVTSAVDYLLERRLREFREAFARLPAGVNRHDVAVDLLWSMFSGPTFYAWLELVVAARTDPELRRTISAIGRRFVENVHRTHRDLFPAPESPSPFFDIAPDFTFSVMEGLALGRIAFDDEPRRRRILDALKGLAALALPGGASR